MTTQDYEQALDAQYARAQRYVRYTRLLEGLKYLLAIGGIAITFWLANNWDMTLWIVIPVGLVLIPVVLYFVLSLIIAGIYWIDVKIRR